MTQSIGANYDLVTDGTTTNGELAKFPLGYEEIGPDGNTYRYVQAAEAISTTLNEPYSLSITEAGQASKLTVANGLTDTNMIGTAPRQIIADNAYFWARMRGTFSIRVTASASADAVLGIGGVGATGRLMSGVTASAGNMIIYGLVISAAASASASAGNTIRTAKATWPLAKTAVAS